MAVVDSLHSPFSVGQRIQIDKSKATVKYVGPVDGQQGVWVGLEWDDASRGKHDGSHGGKRYFSTRDGASSGSFIRESKLRPTANAGCTILDALQQKYDRAQQDAAAAADLRISQRVGVQLVGMDKLQRQRGGIERLEEVSLIDACISSAGETGELSIAAPRLQDLDLSSNLLSRWQDIDRVFTELPGLHTLNLSSNMLRLPEASQPGRYPSMRRLVLNRCGVAFDKVMSLLTCLPGLEELYLEGNNIQNLTFDPSLCAQLTNLKVLGLDENLLTRWEEICRLGKLPALQRLSASRNQLTTLFYPGSQENQGQDAGFSSLTTLILADNRMSDWQSIDELHRFPCLSAFRLSGNPHPGETEDKRYQVVARAGKLASLNGSTVSRSDRKDCELHYLREIVALQRLHRLSPGELTQQHPRFRELQAMYGDVGAMALPDSGPKTLAQTMMRVTFSCNAEHVEEPKRQITKPLPRSVTIAALKMLCQRFFAIPIRDQALVVKISEEAEEDITSSTLRDLEMFESEGCLEIEIRQKSRQ